MLFRPLFFFTSFHTNPILFSYFTLTCILQGFVFLLLTLPEILFTYLILEMYSLVIHKTCPSITPSNSHQVHAPPLRYFLILYTDLFCTNILPLHYH